MIQKINRISYEDALTKYSYNELYNYYIVELHSFKECQQKFNMSQSNLSKLFKHYDIVKSKENIKNTYTRNARLNRWDDNIKEQFKNDYQNNVSYDDLKLKYNISCDKVIYDIVDKLGIPRRKSTYFKKSFDDVIVEFNKDFDKNKDFLMNNSKEDVAKLFDTSTYSIDKLINYFNLKLERNNNIKLLNAKAGQETKLARYGDKNYHNIEKTRQTNLERYGKEFFVNREKTNQTKLERYGSSKYNNRDKAKETMLERYGVTNYSKSDEFLVKTRKTCLERYGVEYPSQPKCVREKISNSLINGGNEKCYITKKRNKSFNTSKIEDATFLKLSYIYSRDELYRQYKDKDRYPYACDFYIKPLDLFIELNIMWTHGNHPFNQNNTSDLDTLYLWQEKAKTSNFYKSALINWTIRDVEKQKCAKEHNLNYVALYDKEVVNNYVKMLYDKSDKLFGLSKQDVFNLCRNNAFPGNKKWSSEHPIWDCYLPKHLSPKQAWYNDCLLKKAIDNLFKILKKCILENKDDAFVLRHKVAFENYDGDISSLLELVLNRFTISKIAPKVTAISKSTMLKIINNSNIDLSNGVYCPMAGFGGIVEAVKEWFNNHNLDYTNKIYAADINENFCNWYGWECKDMLKEHITTNKVVVVCPPFGKEFEHWKGTPDDMSNISFVEWYKLIKEYIIAPNYIIIGPEIKSKNKIGLFSKTVGVQVWTDDMIFEGSGS